MRIFFLFSQTSFSCSLDKDHAVYRMASSGMGVWVTLQSSSAVRLFHATRYECLADVDVAPPVHKMLQGKTAGLFCRYAMRPEYLRRVHR